MPLALDKRNEALENIIHMEEIADSKPTAELSPEIIKTICHAISQEFYNWELKEEKSMGIAYLKFLLLGRKPHI